MAFRATDLSVHRAIKLTIAREGALRKMAADLGVPPKKALEHLVGFVLDDDAAIARRLLHVKLYPDSLSGRKEVLRREGFRIRLGT